MVELDLWWGWTETLWQHRERYLDWCTLIVRRARKPEKSKYFDHPEGTRTRKIRYFDRHQGMRSCKKRKKKPHERTQRRDKKQSRWRRRQRKNRTNRLKPKTFFYLLPSPFSSTKSLEHFLCRHLTSGAGDEESVEDRERGKGNTYLLRSTMRWQTHTKF